MENDLIEISSSESLEGTSLSEEEIMETNYYNEIYEDGNDWIEIAEYGREDTIPPMDPSPNISQFTTISPIDIFRGFFEDNIINEIIKNSNFFAERLRAKPNPWYKIKDLTPLTKLEFENWLAVVIMTGLVSTPKETDYWSRDPLFRNPAISRIMSSSRYKSIQLMLRLSPVHYKDGVNKLEPVYTIFRENCKKNYFLGKFISIKESAVKYKDKHHPAKYTPNQPIKWDFKVYGLYDSATGYMWNFEIYPYKKKGVWKNLSTIAPVSLLESLKVNANKYYLVFDKLCPNLDLLNVLSDLGFSTTGTIKKNIKEVPRAEISKKNSVQFFLKGSLLFCALYEKQPYYFFSNIEGTQHKLVKRFNKVGTKFMTEKPVLCIKHALGMGGSEYFNKLTKPYSTARKSKRWWKASFIYMLEIAIANSFIIYKYYAERGFAVHMTFVVFQRTLASQLINIIEKKPEATPKEMAKQTNFEKIKPQACSYCREMGNHDTTAFNCCAKCKKPIHIRCYEFHICLA